MPRLRDRSQAEAEFLSRTDEGFAEVAHDAAADVASYQEGVRRALWSEMAKVSIFYAGTSKKSEMHVFVHFQHSAKAWEVGQLTINIVLSNREGAPEGWSKAGPVLPHAKHRKLRERFRIEGSYRIGEVLGGPDKCWHLKQDADPIVTSAWRPSSYADPDQVIAEAAQDIASDLRAALGKLKIFHQLTTTLCDVRVLSGPRPTRSGERGRKTGSQRGAVHVSADCRAASVHRKPVRLKNVTCTAESICGKRSSNGTGGRGRNGMEMGTE